MPPLAGRREVRRLDEDVGLRAPVEVATVHEDSDPAPGLLPSAEPVDDLGHRSPRSPTAPSEPWLGWTCGECRYCTTGRENLCPDARFTDDAERLGLYGFGAAAHIVTQVARWQGRRLFAFTRPGDDEGQAFARELGCAWGGASTEMPPEQLDAAILFAPAGELVPAALRATAPGGTVVCAEIHMSDIPSFPYEILWRERVVRSVANLTRRDGLEFLDVARRVPVRTRVTVFPLEEANRAIETLRAGGVEGGLVLEIRGRVAG